MSAEDIYWRVKEGVSQAIRDLDLSGSADVLSIGDKVYSLLSPGNRTGIKSYPCVLVTTFGLAEERHSATNEAENWWFPVMVLIVDREGAGMEAVERTWLTWRSAIRREFQQPRKPAPESLRSQVPEMTDSIVEMRAVFDPNQAEYQGVMSSLVVKVLATERRKGR